MEITELSASRLSAAIRDRQLSCRETMQAYLDRIHRCNPAYNAIVSMLDGDALLEQARQADEALARGDYWGWMHGMPHAVKDLADAAGLPTSLGSPLFAGQIATEDSLHIARMRASGAIFIGKTNTPELGWGSQTYNEVFGTTLNAYDRSLTAGGSSGGTATGLATQMLPVGDGSDLMGSLRNPAAFSNVVGFRPSQGRVPRSDADLFYSQLSTDGPMGRNVEDTIRLLVTMAGYDARAPLSLRDELPGVDAFCAADLDGLRIGWLGDYDGYLATEPGLLELCERAIAPLVDHGAIIEASRPAFDMARLWESWLTLRHFNAGRYRGLYDDPATRRRLKPEAVWEIEGSLDMSAARIAEAAAVRSEWYLVLDALFAHYDLLALPTAQVFPFSADLHWPAEIDGRPMDTYHRWMEIVVGGSLAGLPVINLPAGFDERGRPMGIQFQGRMGRDRDVLEFALRYEQVTDFLDRRPELVAAA